MPDPANSQERFIALLSRHEPVIRASIRSVIRRPEDVDEIMQSVSVIAWRKFDLLTDESGFAKWACVIARYEILSFQRTRARDRLELDEKLVEKIASEGEAEVSDRGRRIALLDRCLGKLPEQRRRLVLQAYEPETSGRELAARSGKTVDGLYQLLRRIRLELKRCVEREFTREREVS